MPDSCGDRWLRRGGVVINARLDSLVLAGVDLGCLWRFYFRRRIRRNRLWTPTPSPVRKAGGARTVFLASCRNPSGERNRLDARILVSCLVIRRLRFARVVDVIVVGDDSGPLSSISPITSPSPACK